jgi:hypothetical protein
MKTRRGSAAWRIWRASNEVQAATRKRWRVLMPMEFRESRKPSSSVHEFDEDTAPH